MLKKYSLCAIIATFTIASTSINAMLNVDTSEKKANIQLVDKKTKARAKEIITFIETAMVKYIDEYMRLRTDRYRVKLILDSTAVFVQRIPSKLRSVKYSQKIIRRAATDAFLELSKSTDNWMDAYVTASMYQGNYVKRILCFGLVFDAKLLIQELKKKNCKILNFLNF